MDIALARIMVLVVELVDMVELVVPLEAAIGASQEAEVLAMYILVLLLRTIQMNAY